MSSNANTNANGFATPFVRDYLPGSAPHHGKRGTFASFEGGGAGDNLLSFGGNGAKRVKGFNSGSGGAMTQDTVLSALNATGPAQAATAAPWAAVDPIIKFELWVPPDATEEDPRFSMVKSTNDLWMAERVVVALDATLSEAAASESQRNLADYALGREVNGKRGSKIRSGAAGARSVAGVPGVVPYAHALTMVRSNLLMATLLVPSAPLKGDGTAEPDMPYPSVARVIDPLHIIGVANNEMSTRDNRGPFVRRFRAEGKVLNIVAQGKTGMYSPVAAAGFAPLSAIFFFAEYTAPPSNVQLSPENAKPTAIPQEIRAAARKVVQFRSWVRDHRNPKAWTQPSLQETRSTDPHGFVQLSRKLRFANFNDARQFRPDRPAGMSYMTSEFSTSNSSLINADIRPVYVK